MDVMTAQDYVMVAASLLAVLAVALVVRASNRNMLRHGWDAHKNGLRHNPAWGKKASEGWQMRNNGEPRP